MEKIKILILGYLMLFSASTAFARDIKFEVSLDKDNIAIGESAQLGLSFQGTQSMPAPDISNIEGLEIRYLGPSTMMTVINGQMSSSVTHMYRIVPLKIGKFQLGPFSFTYKSDNYSSNMVFLDVVEERAAVKVAEEPASTEKMNLDDRLFLTLEVEKPAAYVNELIPVKVKMYVNRLSVSDIQLPTFVQEGFSKVEFKEPKQSKEELNGLIYDTLEFKTNIFGTRSGDYRVGPAKIKCSLMLKKRAPAADLLDDQSYPSGPYYEDFFTRFERHPIELKSQEVHLIISPLPTEGRPVGFTGAVGDYQFIYNAGPTKVKVGDPVTVTMSINGTGNFNTVLQPQLETTDGFKVYEPQVKTEDHTKTFTQVLIPQSELITQIPRAVFSYFDPKAREYKTITHNPIAIQVEKGKDESPSQVVGPLAPAEKSDGKEDLAKDIVYIKESYGRWLETSRTVLRTRLYILILLLPVAIVLSLYIVQGKKNRLKHDSLYASRVAAYKYARKGLKTLRRGVVAGDHKDFYENLFKSTQDYLGARLMIPAAGITYDAVEGALASKEVDPAILAKIKRLFDACDQARFAFSQADEMRMRDDAGELEDIINYFERRKI